MTPEEIKQIAINVITDGYANDTPEDDIKMEMFKEKVPFSKLNSLFKSISIDLGFAADPQVVTKGVGELLPGIPFSTFTDWTQVVAAVEHIADKVPGATDKRITSLITSYCRTETITLPDRPKAASTASGARGGKVPTAIVELFNANAEPTPQEFYNVVRPLVKAHSNAVDYVNLFYAMCFAVKTQVSMGEVVEALRNGPDLPNNDAVAADDEEPFSGDDNDVVEDDEEELE